jgi:hypothetical protein
MVFASTAAGGATQFDGAVRGLFTFASSTGGQAIQVRLNSVSFSTGGAITNWTLSLVDPSDGQEFELLADTTTEFVLGGPMGFMLLPTNSNGTPWRLKFVTTGMLSSGAIKVDIDFVGTEG